MNNENKIPVKNGRFQIPSSIQKLFNVNELIISVENNQLVLRVPKENKKDV